MAIKKAFSSTLFLMFSRIFFRGMTAVIGILLARYLGVEPFGQYSTVIAFVNLFMVFNDLGVSRYSLLESSRDKDKLSYLLGNGLLIEVVLSLILYVVMAVIINIIGYSSIVVQLFVILAIAELLFESKKIYQSTLQSLTKFHLISWQQIIYSLLFFLLVVVTLVFKPEIKIVAYAQLFASAVLFFVYLIFVFRYIRPVFQINKIPGILKKSWIFCVSSVFFIIYFQIGIVLLSIFKSEFDVGLFSATYRLIVAFYMIPQIVYQVALPFIYKFSLTDKEKFSRISHTIQKYLLALAVPLTIFFWLGAEEIIRLVYGKEYMPAISIMQIMGFIVIVRFFTYASAESITAINKQHIRATIEGITAGVNVILNLILIPKYSYTGSAIATLISELVLGMLFYLYIENYFKEGLFRSLKHFLPTLISGAVMALVFMLLLGKLNVLIVAIIGALVYAVALYIFRFLSSYDIKLIKEIFPFLDKKANQVAAENDKTGL